MNAMDCKVYLLSRVFVTRLGNSYSTGRSTHELGWPPACTSLMSLRQGIVIRYSTQLDSTLVNIGSSTQVHLHPCQLMEIAFNFVC